MRKVSRQQVVRWKGSEFERIMFLIQRDGFEKTNEFAQRVFHSYGDLLKAKPGILTAEAMTVSRIVLRRLLRGQCLYKGILRGSS